MCRYSEIAYKVHYVCVPCRQSHKHPWDGAEHLCTRCRAPMIFAAHDFAAPRKTDDRGWAAVAAVLQAGLRARPPRPRRGVAHPLRSAGQAGVREVFEVAGEGGQVEVQDTGQGCGDESRLLADGWSIATADGGRAAHFEHSIAITADGPVVLTRP